MTVQQALITQTVLSTLVATSVTPTLTQHVKQASNVSQHRGRKNLKHEKVQYQYIFRCSEWDSGSLDQNSDEYWRKLAIECTRFGNWARLTGADGADEDYDEVLNGSIESPEAPSEPNCKPLPIEILPGVRDEEGADFLCDNDLELNEAGTHLEIVAPNTCVLLCDFHLSMSLDCRIDEAGETKCYDDGDDDPTDPSNIYCWTPPTAGPTATTTTAIPAPTTTTTTTP